MNDDIVPASLHATTITSSPPLDPCYRALSPTSSEPPLFSSDDPPDEVDVGNYQSPRYKRKRVGAWWETDALSSQPLPERKKAKMSRNFDSGVWLQSDASQSSQDANPSQLPGNDPVLPRPRSLSDLPFVDQQRAADEMNGQQRQNRYYDPLFDSDIPYADILETARRWDERRPDDGPRSWTLTLLAAQQRLAKEKMSAQRSHERDMLSILHEGVEHGETYYHFTALDLEDYNLSHLKILNQVIRTLPTAGVDVPAEGQYRSMEPEIYLNLSQNKLCHLKPSLFQIQFLTTLVLRDNEISELPPQIGHLRNLKELDLACNYLEWLPSDLLDLLPSTTTPRSGQLEHLTLVGNPTLYMNDRQHEQNAELIGRMLYKSNRNLFPPRNPAIVPAAMKEAWSKLESEELLNFSWRVARTPVTYKDTRGSVVKGSAVLPKSYVESEYSTDDSDEEGAIDEFRGASVNAINDFESGPSRIPAMWFEPQTRSGVQSLLRLTMHRALEYEPNPREIAVKLGPNRPSEVDIMLLRALRNRTMVHGPLRRCNTCHKGYVIPAAEWVEFRYHRVTGVQPYMFRVCSWGCVPDELAKKPE